MVFFVRAHRPATIHKRSIPQLWNEGSTISGFVRAGWVTKSAPASRVSSLGVGGAQCVAELGGRGSARAERLRRANARETRGPAVCALSPQARGGRTISGVVRRWCRSSSQCLCSGTTSATGGRTLIAGQKAESALFPLALDLTAAQIVGPT